MSKKLFEKGCAPGPGRPKGSVNKLTSILNSLGCSGLDSSEFKELVKRMVTTTDEKEAIMCCELVRHAYKTLPVNPTSGAK